MKKAMLGLAPRAASSLLAARARAQSHRVLEEWGLTRLTRALIDRLGPVVRAGPFSGMVLSPMSHREHLGPYLLGTYESELHPWIRAILAQSPTQVVDIGSRFGYYAVGFARLVQTASVTAFDPDPWARKATREMARVNRVPSIDVRRYCTPCWLQANLRPGSLVFSDCEGFEKDLFCSTPIPALQAAIAIIELHEESVPGITESVRAAFSDTHELEFATTSEKPSPDVDLSFLSPADRQRAIDEVRDIGQQWVLLRPKHELAARFSQ
jgi:hypothetical protein